MLFHSAVVSDRRTSVRSTRSCLMRSSTLTGAWSPTAFATRVQASRSMRRKMRPTIGSFTRSPPLVPEHRRVGDHLKASNALEPLGYIEARGILRGAISRANCCAELDAMILRSQDTRRELRRFACSRSAVNSRWTRENASKQGPLQTGTPRRIPSTCAEEVVGVRQIKQRCCCFIRSPGLRLRRKLGSRAGSSGGGAARRTRLVPAQPSCLAGEGATSSTPLLSAPSARDAGA